jgi:hypothetical protein
MLVLSLVFPAPRGNIVIRYMRSSLVMPPRNTGWMAALALLLAAVAGFTDVVGI